MTEPLVYGPERVRRIRTALGAAIALGVLCGVFAVLIGVTADRDAETVGSIIFGIIAAGTILWSLLTWRLLDAADRSARRAVILTGVLLMLFALPTFPLGILFAVVGLLLVFLAVTADEGAGR